MTNVGPDKFRELLTRAEGDSLDFKADGYDLKRDRNAFIKDVLALANTPRDTTAYIVLGVRWTPESGSDVTGMQQQIDDVELQDAFSTDRVQPNPQFVYTPLLFDGKQVGVIEIPRSNTGPYTPVKDLDGLQAGAIYYRRGTKNDRAVGAEIRRILAWFETGRVGDPQTVSTHEWRQLLNSVHQFSRGTTYVLACDRLPGDFATSAQALGLPSWRCVIDFDPDSEGSGLLSIVSTTLGQHRVIHRAVRNEYRVQPEPGTHWYFARGLSGRADTLGGTDRKSWLKSYRPELQKQLSCVAASVAPSPVVALVLWSDPSLIGHLRALIEELHGAFGDSVEVVLVSHDGPAFEGLAEDVAATFVRMTYRSLCSGIAVHFSDMNGVPDERCVLPGASGAPVEVPSSTWLWLSEATELVHRGVGLVGNDDASDFRRGASVTWRNLHLRHDCDRDAIPPARAQVEAELRLRQTARVNLYHAPGAGGTTAGRRIAWDLHDRVPVALLKHCKPRDAAERISKIAALTENAVLIIVDGELHAESDIDDIYNLLKANQTPAVLLQVLRRFAPVSPGKRQFWLAAELSDAEADRFRDAFGHAAPNRREDLAKLARRRSDSHRNAFFFGLTAFGRDFRGITRHVEGRIASLTDVQQRVLTYLAIAHYYGQQAVPGHAFAPLLGLTTSRTLELSSVFAGNAIHALELMVEGTRGEWRIVHHLVALEIMQQVLAPRGARERETVWRQNLSSWGKEFASFCRGDASTASERLLELVRRVFVYRDNVEVLGTERAASRRLAQFVEDIPSAHGRIEVLRHLTDCFPLEAHFHAHLGRLLGIAGEHLASVACIDFAISIQPGDRVLHHMRGMAIRSRLRMESETGAPIDQLVESAKDASESFETARQRGPDVEHGYISEVQMLVDLVDRVGRGADSSVRDVLARADCAPYLRQALGRAEELLDRVQHLHAGEGPSRYALECRARLERAYGDYNTALQAWDSLLSRPEVAKGPVRRQIVWTLLRRKGGIWADLSTKELDRIRGLLEDNLDEELSDSTSLRLWLRVVRQVVPAPSLDLVIERVGYWKANTGSLDAAYYLYVLHTIRALGGSSQGAADAERTLEECRSLAKFRRDRTRSFEWIGPGAGVASLVHQSRLGDWKGDFWEHPGSLRRLRGRVASLEGPQKGTLELNGRIMAFFVPGRSGLQLGRDENLLVECYLGFSYDGPRAWDVKGIE